MLGQTIKNQEYEEGKGYQSLAHRKYAKNALGKSSSKQATLLKFTDPPQHLS